ncbi:putative phage tail protein [Clostridium beijerinckii]|uniref:YmfQ family protein n=1 Tax=Clostridium beijerinckii TaxID=1520 RepID=A0A7X9SRE9_CLOBE|nr:putative phage tail protein [Clostridium beijerinckii]NMF06507.1 YmfQ family protein [Clostridium beijerinckii]
MSNTADLEGFKNIKIASTSSEDSGNESKDKLESYVIDEMKNSYIFQEIFNAYGNSFDKLGLDISDLFLQILPQTATEWGLKLWEERVGITTNNAKSIEERRARVLAKLNSKGTTTVEVIKQICKSFVSEAEIIQNNPEYYFQVNLISDTGFPYALDSLYDSIEIAKPAHLGVKYKLISMNQSEMYYGLASIMGETMTVYPWGAKNIEFSGKMESSISQCTGSESITIYPSKEMS